MASTVSCAGDQDATELDILKKNLQSYREVLIPLNKVIEWDQSYYPAVLIGVTTLIFSIIWYLEPSVLTTVCLLGLTFSIIDCAMPSISAYLSRSSEWTEQKSLQYEQICIRLCNAKRHFANMKQSLLVLRRDKPNAYLLVVVGTFTILAWFGSLIDNLLLLYLIVFGAVLVPGLRKHGMLQKAVSFVTDKVASLRGGVPPKATVKPKSN